MKKVLAVVLGLFSASAVFALNNELDAKPTSLRRRSVEEYVKTLEAPESLDVRSVMIQMTSDDCQEVMQSVPVEDIAPRTRVVFEELSLVTLFSKKYNQSFVIKHMLLHPPREVKARLALLEKYAFPSETRDSFVRLALAVPAHVTARRLRCIVWVMGFLFDFDEEQHKPWDLRRRLEHLAFGIESLSQEAPRAEEASAPTSTHPTPEPATAAAQNVPFEQIEEEMPVLSDWERARVLRLLSLSKRDLGNVLECAPRLFLELEGKEEGGLSVSVALRNIAAQMGQGVEGDQDVYTRYTMAVYILPQWLNVNQKAVDYVEKFLVLKDLLFPPLSTKGWLQWLDLFLSIPHHWIDKRVGRLVPYIEGLLESDKKREIFKAAPHLSANSLHSRIQVVEEYAEKLLLQKLPKSVRPEIFERILKLQTAEIKERLSFHIKRYDQDQTARKLLAGLSGQLPYNAQPTLTLESFLVCLGD
ncbi:MAG: hypothetical protein HYX35_01135 [Proteobacteria bacterium]|nr:hypothetical protein [Pseudomonadota bacterium]